jgi:hypothetical protein
MPGSFARCIRIRAYLFAEPAGDAVSDLGPLGDAARHALNDHVVLLLGPWALHQARAQHCHVRCIERKSVTIMKLKLVDDGLMAEISMFLTLVPAVQALRVGEDALEDLLADGFPVPVGVDTEATSVTLIIQPLIVVVEWNYVPWSFCSHSCPQLLIMVLSPASTCRLVVLEEVGIQLIRVLSTLHCIM